LALSGGATHGAAHIGILQALDREGIRPDFVAGTSAGALVGGAYCAGVPLDELSRLFLEMDWPTLLRISIKKPLSLFDTQPMEAFIKEKIGDGNFSDLQIPFAAIACDITNGEKVVLDKGPLAPALRASAAIPGLFSPVEIGGRMLVDGGIVDNLPVEQVRLMGAKYVIACDVSKRGKLNKPPSNPFEIVLQMIYIMQNRSALVECDDCDCYIRPEVSQYSSWGFGDAQKVLEAGQHVGNEAIAQLKKDLRL
jgi:NTE family protein